MKYNKNFQLNFVNDPNFLIRIIFTNENEFNL